MPTSTPPPYFPQNTLSPGDERTRKKIKLAMFGCIALVLGAVVGGIVGIVYLFKSLS